MLTSEQRAEVSDAYWFSDANATDVGALFGLPRTGRSGQVETWRYVDPLPTGEACIRCGGQLVWTTRQARKDERSCCEQCGHTSTPWGGCRCDACREAADASEELLRGRSARRRRRSWEHWESVLHTYDHVAFAWPQLSPLGQSFYAVLVRRLTESEGGVSWSEVAQEIGLRDHVRLVDELEKVGLVCLHAEDGYIVNTLAGVPTGPDWFEEIEEALEAHERQLVRWECLTNLLTEGDYEDLAAFDSIAQLVPALAELRAEIGRLPTASAAYCDRDAWWGRAAFAGKGISRRIEAIVDHAGQREQLLPRDLVVELASRRLRALMPLCQRHHDHPTMSGSYASD